MVYDGTGHCASAVLEHQEIYPDPNHLSYYLLDAYRWRPESPDNTQAMERITQEGRHHLKSHIVAEEAKWEARRAEARAEIAKLLAETAEVAADFVVASVVIEPGPYPRDITITSTNGRTAKGYLNRDEWMGIEVDGLRHVSSPAYDRIGEDAKRVYEEMHQNRTEAATKR